MRLTHLCQMPIFVSGRHAMSGQTPVVREHRHRASRSAYALLAAWLLLPFGTHAAALWSVDKLVKDNLTAVSGTPVVLPDRTTLQNVRIEYLRAVFEAHKRIGDVSKVNSKLALLVDGAP